MKKFLLIFLSIYLSSFRAVNYHDRSDLYCQNSEINTTPCSNLLKTTCLTPAALKIAWSGYANLKARKQLKNDTLLSIIDYSLPSSLERFFIINTYTCEIVENVLVAHGKSSGILSAESFSNSSKSNKSCLGFFITDKTYKGNHDYSLKIIGIEKDINDNALQRGIVIHGADYVSYPYIQKYGRIGRSLGCPALPVNKNKRIIDLIKNGSCLFIYYPSEEYILNSAIVGDLPQTSL